MPSYAEALAMRDLDSLGLVSPRRYAHRWDPREDEDIDPVDHGWIGEDQDGVWLAVHPDAALMSHPELWGPISLWRSGVQALSRSDAENMSAIEVEAHRVLTSASERDGYRRAKESIHGEG